MAKSDTIAGGSIELPPNKAVAAGGGAGAGPIIVGLILYYCAPDTPAHIVGMWDTLAAIVTAAVAAYATPHGAVLKE